MRIPGRSRADAFCGGPPTLYQRLAGILAPLILLGTIAYLLIIWQRLPEQIPTHYNAAGEIDGTGGRGTLLLMPLIGLATDLTIALTGLFPRSWNTGVRVTMLNRTAVYRLVRDLLADLRLSLALLFGGFGIYQASLPEHFSGWVTVALIPLITIPLLRYFIRIRRV